MCKFCNEIALAGVSGSFPKLAVFTLEDEQIVWTDKSSNGLFDHRYPKLYGRLDRVTFDRHVTAKL